MPTKLPTRTMGRNGPQIPALGFGLMGLSCKLCKSNLEDIDKAHISTKHFTEYPHPSRNASSFSTAFMSSDACIGTQPRSTAIVRSCLGDGFNEQASGRKYD